MKICVNCEHLFTIIDYSQTLITNPCIPCYSNGKHEKFKKFNFIQEIKNARNTNI